MCAYLCACVCISVRLCVVVCGCVRLCAVVRACRIWAHTLGIEGNAHFTYLEGCFHLLTPFIPGGNTTATATTATATTAAAAGNGGADGGALARAAAGMGLSANFPGVTLSTGM